MAGLSWGLGVLDFFSVERAVLPMFVPASRGQPLAEDWRKWGYRDLANPLHLIHSKRASSMPAFCLRLSLAVYHIAFNITLCQSCLLPFLANMDWQHSTVSFLSSHIILESASQGSWQAEFIWEGSDLPALMRTVGHGSLPAGWPRSPQS